MLNSACEGKFYVFHGVDIIWTILCLSSGLRGTPSGRKLHCVTGHRSRSDLEEGVTSGLLYSVTLGLT